MKEIDENLETYKRNVEELRRHSRRFNGLEKAVEVIEDIKA
jgi:hypothetical protein